MIRNASGKWLLHGLLPSASIQMNHIMIPKAGDYLVRIVYSAGIRGLAEISANGGTAVAVAGRNGKMECSQKRGYPRTGSRPALATRVKHDSTLRP